MRALPDLQAVVRDVLLGAEPGDLATMIHDDGIAPEARLDIYRHHVLTTLTEVLEAAFPVVCRLVDRRFFGYLASAFLREHPPAGPCLFEYGGALPEFLARFAPCRHLAWLPDVARLEWAIHAAFHAGELPAIDPERLGTVAPADLPGLRLRLDPSMAWVASPWPVDRIWRAHQPGAGPPEPVSLQAGGACLEIRRIGEDVALRPLDEATHAFRHALADGRPLEEAMAAALDADLHFDLARAIRDLLDERAVVGLLPGP